MNKHYFLIKTTDSEYSSSYKRICETYEEAVKQVPNYANFYCNQGTCTIVEVDANFKEINNWYFNGGVLR